MGAWIWIAIIAVVVIAVVNGVKNQSANDAALGATAGQVYRTIMLNYLGGHPSNPQPIKGCALVVTPSDVAIEKGAGLPVRVPMTKVLKLTVETESEARRRYTATRMLALGVFALAAPKKTAGSVLITVDTVDGPLVFEKEKATKAQALKALGPSIAAVNLAISKRPASAPTAPTAALAAPQASVADELTKLMALRDGGALTAAEFDAQKALVLAGGPPDPAVASGEPAAGTVSLVLVDPGALLINVIKVVRSLTPLGLREAKNLVDSAPAVVLDSVTPEHPEHAKAALELAGATCEIRPEGGL